VAFIVRYTSRSAPGPPLYGHAREGSDCHIEFFQGWGVRSRALDGNGCGCSCGVSELLQDSWGEAFGSSGEKAQNQSYDPNIRPALLGSHAEAKATFEALVPLTDVVKLSHEDAPPPDR